MTQRSARRKEAAACPPPAPALNAARPRGAHRVRCPSFRAASITLLAGLGVMLNAYAAAPADDVASRYHVLVDGPLGEFRFDCESPCEIDKTRRAGEASTHSRLEVARKPVVRMGSHIPRDPDRSYLEDGVRCFGACDDRPAAAQVRIATAVALSEGVELRIRDDRARLVFHSIVEREDGPATRAQYSEFFLDRPTIRLEAFGHQITVERDTELASRMAEPPSGSAPNPAADAAADPATDPSSDPASGQRNR